MEKMEKNGKTEKKVVKILDKGVSVVIYLQQQKSNFLISNTYYYYDNIQSNECIYCCACN